MQNKVLDVGEACCTSNNGAICLFFNINLVLSLKIGLLGYNYDIGGFTLRKESIHCTPH